MATYFHGGTEIQADGLQTLYLMNPNYVGYSDTQQSLFLNSASGNTLSQASMSHAPPHSNNHHFVGIPLPAASTTIRSPNTDDPSRQSVHFQNEISMLHGMPPRFQYNLWSAGDKYPTSTVETMSPPAKTNMTTTDDMVSQLGFLRPGQQGLSLSLSAQQPAYRSSLHGEDGMTAATLGAAVISPTSRVGGDEGRGMGGSPSSVSAVSNGIAGVQSVLLGSKYLKAAQQLLDEVVNVGRSSMKSDESAAADLGKEKMIKVSKESMAGDGPSNGGGESSHSKRGVETTTAQRQELQMKKAKLINMLDEVEQRYRQYHQQMQIVATSFEQVAGLGSARSYTALALQTISKQFRCLKDAIAAQIKATGKSLGEEDCSSGGKIEGSRLKFVDHQLRQQRALQHLGMIQHTAWRPQRGLPERAVSVLRAWLFEHFLHPYPKDSDKHMLARQTGLSRSQVSNWFINARVRLWKPMVEEMYMEEIKDQENHNNPHESSNTKSNDEMGSKSSAPQKIISNNTIHLDKNITNDLQSKVEKSTSPNETSNPMASTSPLGGSGSMQAQMEWIVQSSPKKPRAGSEMHTSLTDMLSMNIEKQERDDSNLFIPGPTGSNNGFGAYPIGELGRSYDHPQQQMGTRFRGNNGVSLTLGLPHNCENLSPLSGNQHSYIQSSNNNQSNMHDHQMGSDQVLDMGNNVDHGHYNFINSPQPSPHSGVGFENLSIQNRKRFAAQLLRDFVA